MQAVGCGSWCGWGGGRGQAEGVCRARAVGVGAQLGAGVRVALGGAVAHGHFGAGDLKALALAAGLQLGLRWHGADQYLAVAGDFGLGDVLQLGTAQRCGAWALDVHAGFVGLGAGDAVCGFGEGAAAPAGTSTRAPGMRHCRAAQPPSTSCCRWRRSWSLSMTRWGANPSPLTSLTWAPFPTSQPGRLICQICPPRLRTRWA